MSVSIKLKTESILRVPLNNYPKDFTFDVNGQLFQTSKIIADLLSSKIAKLHQSDPTISEYTITTKSRGNFTNFLELCLFNEKEISDNESSFVCELFEKLGTENVDITKESIEITTDNVIEMLIQHEKWSSFHADEIEREVDFISENFGDLVEKRSSDLRKLGRVTLEKIIGNDRLIVESESQLLKFVSSLYAENDEFSDFYEYVYFENVSGSEIDEFVSQFRVYDMTSGMWNSLCRRLVLSVEPKSDNLTENRHHKTKKDVERKKNQLNSIDVEFTNNDLKGIFSYFRSHSSINEEVNVTCSSHSGGDIDLLLDIENRSNDFYTGDYQNSWICFEFKNHLLIPSSYSIRAHRAGPGGNHQKSWVLEGSNDKSDWKSIDEHENCSYLNESFVVHTFPILYQNENKEPFKYIRIRQTSQNWCNNNTLNFCSIELYGKLV